MWRSRALAASLLLLASPALCGAPLGIGRAPTPEEIRGWDIDVRADGQGLPEGKGTVAKGEKIYAKQCLSCHGAEGRNPPIKWVPPLAGGKASFRVDKTIGGFWPYAPTVFDYTRRAMPYGNAGSLSNEEVYSVTAYMLFLNHLLPADATLDAASLSAIRMPNRDGFVPDPRPDVP